MPDLVWLESVSTEGGIGALLRSTPAEFTNKPGPDGGGGMDFADALGVAGEGSKGHAPVLKSQDHFFDADHLAGRELAKTRISFASKRR
jgi:hypothetical protein